MTNVFFDLDGTLTDSAEGILASFRHTLQGLRVRPPAEQDLRRCIGPPLHHSFARLLASEDKERIQAAVDMYRAYYALHGVAGNRVYPGVSQMLRELAARGMRLFVVTSKQEEVAGDILRAFGLQAFFRAVHGSVADGTRSSKTSLIAHALHSNGLDAQSCVMVGDRHFDIAGALENGVRAVGVTYGYGSGSELRAAGAKTLCASPCGLRVLLEQMNKGSA